MKSISNKTKKIYYLHICFYLLKDYRQRFNYVEKNDKNMTLQSFLFRARITSWACRMFHIFLSFV